MFLAWILFCIGYTGFTLEAIIDCVTFTSALEVKQCSFNVENEFSLLKISTLEHWRLVVQWYVRSTDALLNQPKEGAVSGYLGNKTNTENLPSRHCHLVNGKFVVPSVCQPPYFIPFKWKEICTVLNEQSNLHWKYIWYLFKSIWEGKCLLSG